MIPTYTPDLKGMLGGAGLYADADYSNLNYSAEEEKDKDSHIHSYCEIYFNISGDVAFAVENSLYEIDSGDIIITKPNEFHRCIYRSDCRHEHYCFWINAEENMLPYLKSFYGRKNGEGNHIKLSDADAEKFRKNLNILIDNKGYGKFTDSESLSALFSILNIVDYNSASFKEASTLPENFAEILKYIDKHFHSFSDIKEITDKFFISRSSLNRYFRQYLGTTPHKYLETRRLAAAKEMLESCCAVQDVAAKCGFPDYSHFISLFKKRFGITPHKYKNIYK